MKVGIALATALATVPIVGASFVQDQASAPTAPISSDELDVYDAVLSSWFDGERGPHLINMRLIPAPSSSDSEYKECARGTRFSPAAHPGHGDRSLAGVRFKTSG